MRKVLLGTTALAAAALIAAPAMADDEMAGPVTVSLSGYTVGIVGVNSTDMTTSDDDLPTDMPGHIHDTVETDHPTRGEEVFHIFEFAISGSTTLDNGITVAVHSQLGSSGGAAVFDEQHITMSGSFGSLRIGRTESAAFNATVSAPAAASASLASTTPGTAPQRRRLTPSAGSERKMRRRWSIPRPTSTA